MSKFKSFLAPLIESYITYQKASGKWNIDNFELNIRVFDRYCMNYYPNHKTLNQDMVDSWCKQRETENNNSCLTRTRVIVSFIGYLRKRGLTEVVKPSLPRPEPSTYIPHAFTDDELHNFFRACDELPAGKSRVIQSRKLTVPVFFRLLYSSGIRTNEARLLRVCDVDLLNGILNIHNSKGEAQHFVVMHDTMLELMARYDTAIKKLFPRRQYFFPSPRRSYYTRVWLQNNFRELWTKYNPSYATVYELRHHYATENINQWVGEGFEFSSKLLRLSKSMGHSTLESTKYYYSLVPTMSDILEAKTGQDFDAILPEVDYEESYS